jgi:hypothetical protein
MAGAARVIATGNINRIRPTLWHNISASMSVDHLKLQDYIPQAWPVIEPNNPLIDNWHIGCMAEHFEAVVLQQITRLAISMHPRSAKSNIGTILFPTWVWTERPWLRFIFGSYSGNLATKHSLSRRRVISSEWYQKNWRNVFQIMPDQNSKSEYENTARGSMFATGRGGSVTGQGADIEVLDDFINPDEAESEAERKHAIDTYQNSFIQRLDDKKRSAIVVLAQRTHVNDLTGHVLKEGGWTHLEFPAIAEQRIAYSFPLSGQTHVREIGDILNTAREDKETLGKMKIAAGSRKYAAQWQCAPSSDSGNMVKSFWWKFYDEEPRELAAKMDVLAQSWDFAFKDLESGSWVVGWVMGRKGSKKYIFSETRGHLDFVKTCEAVTSMASLWPRTTHKFYEDRANGPAVKAALDRKISGLVPVPPVGSKPARMSAATGEIEAGDVMFPNPFDKDGNPRPDRQWVLDAIEEMAHFPEEPNDRGDVCSQGILMLNEVKLYDEGETEEVGAMFDDLGNLDNTEGGFDVGNF